MFIKVLVLTVFGMYFIGVAINAYLKFDGEDIDWDDLEKQVKDEKNSVVPEFEENQPYIIHTKEDAEAWNLVEYNETTIREQPKTGKDLKLEIKK